MRANDYGIASTGHLSGLSGQQPIIDVNLQFALIVAVGLLVMWWLVRGAASEDSPALIKDSSGEQK